MVPRRQFVQGGGEYRFDHYNQVGNQFSRGSFAFDGRATWVRGCDAGRARPRTFLLGYMRSSESAVALASTAFRSASQACYFSDTWRVSDDMTLDLGIRYEYVPPWLDNGGTLINASLPYRDTGMPVADLSRHPVLVRIGEGDFYEDSPIRFAPNIQVTRDGRLGGRLVDDDKLNFAPRVGWAWTPSATWSVRAGAGVFYMQDTGNPRFDMARNAAGRRQDIADPVLLNLNWNAPFAGSGTNVCGVQPPLVCVANTTSWATSSIAKRRHVSSSSTSSASSGRRRYWRSAISGPAANGSSGCDANEVTPGPAACNPAAVSGIHQDPQIGNVAEAEHNFRSPRNSPGGSIADLGAGRLHVVEVEDNGSGIRVLNGDALFPQNSTASNTSGTVIFDVRHRS